MRLAVHAPSGLDQLHHVLAANYSPEASTYSANYSDNDSHSSHGASPLHSPEARSPYMRSPQPPGVGRLYFMYSSPLSQDQLDVRSELQLLQTALRSGRGLTERRPFEVSIDVRLGRADHLLDLLTHGDAACPGSPVCGFGPSQLYIAVLITKFLMLCLLNS